MHIYAITRGQKFDVDRFITELQGKYLNTKLKLNKEGQIDKDGEWKDMAVQLGVRPVQLWEIACPKEHKDLIISTLADGHPINRPWQKEYRFIDKWVFAPIRKALGLQKVDKYDNKQKLPVYHDFVDVLILGTREDKQEPWGEGI